MNRFPRAARALAVAFILSGCGTVQNVLSPVLDPRPQPTEAERQAMARAAALAAVPPRPEDAPATGARSVKVWKDALKARGTRVVVSTSDRALWVLRDTTVLLRAPVAVGMQEPFTYAGRTYDFKTPVGQRKVRGKGTDPLWAAPDWHYYEKAVAQKLEPVKLTGRSKITLSDGTRIEVRGKDVGRVNSYGNFWAFTPGTEIIFDGKIFIPPFGTRQRQVPEVLGTHKLELGDGYLIHGTDQEDSIGDAVSHGCVRMYNEDVAKVYEIVPVGAAVFIY